MTWQDDNKWESDWWGTCTNTFWEETKQQVYARKMGLIAQSELGKYPVFDLQDKTVLDIGGGPVSLLLKCKNMGAGIVVDPCKYPAWVRERYAEVHIEYIQRAAEDINKMRSLIKYDEVWIYNVLQHTIDPKQIIENALSVGKIVRIFEWVDTEITEGHPHVLTEDKLNEWLGGIGKVEQLNENGCHGKAYYGVFKGKLYE